jgi:hypothetical protein
VKNARIFSAVIFDFNWTLHENVLNTNSNQRKFTHIFCRFNSLKKKLNEAGNETQETENQIPEKKEIL